MTTDSTCVDMLLFTSLEGGTTMICKHNDITCISYMLSLSPSLSEQDDEIASTEWDSRSLLCSSLIWSPSYRPWRISSGCRLSPCTIRHNSQSQSAGGRLKLANSGWSNLWALAWCIFDLAASIMAVNSAFWFAPSLLFWKQAQVSKHSQPFKAVSFDLVFF